MAGRTFFDMIDNVAHSMSQLTNSYIFTGANIANPNKGTGPTGDNRFMGNAEVYYDFLKDYHFVNSVLEVYSSNITESIEKCDFFVEIKGQKHSPVADEINRFLELSNLREYIKNHISEFIYRGQYSFLVNFDENTIDDIEKPYSVEIIKEGGNIKGYLYENKFIPASLMATYYFKPSQIEIIKDKNILKELDTSNDSAKLKKLDKNSIDSIKVKYSKFKGESIFKKQLTRIFQMFALEYSLFYLGLRDTLRPELLGMSTGGRSINVAQSLNMANNIESLLNQSTQGMANIMDPMAFMNNLTFQILNYVKVVPAVEQYSNINDISFGDLSNKRDKLKTEREQIQRDVLNNLAIPEELYAGGSANRWEVMARNDRYMTMSDTILKSITRLIKDIAISYARYKNIPLSTHDIQFNLDFTSMLTSYDVKSKVEACTDKFGNIARLMQSVSEIFALNMIDKPKMYKYMIDQLSGIDEKLVKAFPETMPEYAGQTDEMIMQKQQQAQMLQEQQMQMQAAQGGEGGDEVPPEEQQQYEEAQEQEVPQEEQQAPDGYMSNLR